MEVEGLGYRGKQFDAYCVRRGSARLASGVQRKAQAGQMIWWDGSTHDWLEGRGSRLCLMGAIDDATSRTNNRE